MEIAMKPATADHAEDSSLRLVFKDAVMLYRIPSPAITFGDIAQTLDELSSERRNDIVAIDVIFGEAQNRTRHLA
jgi:hypothetical protein